MVTKTYTKLLPRGKDDFHHPYTESQKLEAVKLWLITGNLTHVAAALGIGRPTVSSWRYSDWWAETVRELQAEENIALSNKLRTIAGKSLKEMEDRIENGDWIFDQKKGKLIRKPVAMRDLARATNDMLERKTKLEKNDKKETNEKALADRLVAIAQKFEEIAQRRVEVTDVIEYKETREEDALSNERQAQLSEGIGMGKET
jgi:hypothetical protein